jgi:hypothetical protein
MSVAKQAKAFLESITNAIAIGHGQSAYDVGEKSIDLVSDGFLEAVESANVCDDCEKELAKTLQHFVNQLGALRGEAAIDAGVRPEPMCKGPEGTIVVSGGGEKELQAAIDKLPGELVECSSCKGRGYKKALTPGGTRVVRDPCLRCKGKGKV